MAPNKKKKKAAVNLARGFATTSTPSKIKTNVSEDVEKASDTAGPKDDLDPSVTAPDDGTSMGKSENPRNEPSPEAWEKQIEDSEFQNLIDKYGESTRKASSRQLSRLQTERRLLRTQADHLKTWLWLPSELIQVILDRLTVQGGKNRKPQEPVAHQTVFDPHGEDILIKLWTLHQLLPKIGFSSSQQKCALHELLRREQTGSLPYEIGGKDSTWGLPFCLDWFARFADSNDVVNYHDSKSVPNARLESSSRTENQLVSAQDISRSETPLSQPTSESQAALTDIDTANSSPQVTGESDSDMESDLEPDEMIKKYLTLRTRRFHISPEDDRPKSRKNKKLNAQALPFNHASRQAAHLDLKIAKLKSDLLFDQDEADRQWLIAKIELAKEAADRKRLGIDEQDRANVKNDKLGTEDTISAADEVENEAAMLGDFFSNLPDTASSGGTDMQLTDPLGNLIKVKDFGKWNGISPRRILEEASKARDASCVITFKSLSETAFSKRHHVQIVWSSPQEVVSPIPIEGISCEMSSVRSSITMDRVSCSNTLQSEAYVSTIALFLIIASSTKEDKIHLRLPPVWRDVWEDLRLLQKSESDTRDITTLRELRAIIAEQKNPDDVTRPELVSRSKGPTQEVASAEDYNSNDVASATNAQALKSIWISQSSTSLYQSMLDFRKGLPIWNYKQELLQAFKDNQIVIVCGETGCGKSTQVPAYILESELSNGQDCKIYCTEPRRISAISLARRVSEELGERRGDVGTSRSLVGFAVRLDSQVTSRSRLVYATTGIVMRMLESANGLKEVTHLVLDEVHERSIETDFLLIVLRKLLVHRPTLRVVLMSATVDAERFSNYLDGAPVITVPGRTYPVETKFLEDAIEATKFRNGGVSAGQVIEEDEDERDDDAAAGKTLNDSSANFYSPATRETLANFDEYRVNYNLIVKLLELIAASPIYAEYSKAILVFLPGIAEIRGLNDMLVGNKVFASRWAIFPLHSTIATDEQERAFLIPPPEIRKIVIATNIAETGITIPDVTCVIDAGKHKEMRFDEKRQLSRLIESFISRANAKQRRGRAGRVQKGLCFHLFTKHRHDSLLPEQQTPEMLRLSLQDLVLRVKICKLGGIEETLSEALDPPSARNTRRAVDALIDVKALTATEELTSLGRQLARLPLDVFLGKLILLGSIFGCLDAALSTAAILSSKSPFSAPLGSRTQADLARMAFKKGDSDLLTVYNAYCAWRRICSEKHGMSEQQFCRRNFMNAQTLCNIEELKGQLLLSLVDARFVSITQAEKQALNSVRSYSRQRHFVPILPQYDNNGANDLILNSIIASSFYPKILRRDGKGWRNIANNQSVSLHPTSVNKRVERPPHWLSFYHIMQSSNKFYNAHETSAVEDFALVLLCGEADFKMYSGVVVIDGNRMRFAVDDWKQLLAIRTLRTEIRDIMTQSFKHPGRALSEWQRGWLDIWQKALSPAS